MKYPNPRRDASVIEEHFGIKVSLYQRNNDLTIFNHFVIIAVFSCQGGGSISVDGRSGLSRDQGLCGPTKRSQSAFHRILFRARRNQERIDQVVELSQIWSASSPGKEILLFQKRWHPKSKVKIFPFDSEFQA